MLAAVVVGHLGEGVDLIADSRQIFIGYHHGGEDEGAAGALYLKHRTEAREHPAATFYARVKGSSMIDAGIGDGDILVIDKSLDPKDGDIAICFLDGEFTVKRMLCRDGGLLLMPANPEFQPIRITEENDFLVWGVVTYIIHKAR